MAWWILFLAGLCEIGWAIGLKYAAGFTKFWPSAFTILFLILSFAFLAQAVKTIPLGTGYVVWTGMGAVGTFLLGIILFHEPVNAIRIVGIFLILSGIICLKLFSTH